MSNVVQFLEMLGRNPEQASDADYLAVAAAVAADAPVRQALVNKDVAELNRLIGGSENVLCFLVPAENDAPQDDGDDEQQGNSDDAQDANADVKVA